MRDALLSLPMLVVSCDKYADMWPSFFGVLKKRWPDCPFPLYLGSNFLSHDDREVRTIAVGRDKSWAENLIHMLDVLNVDYVVLMLEDFLVKDAVDTSRLVVMIDYCLSRRIDCARLAPLPPPTPLPPSPLEDFPQLGIVPIESPYRVSAQAALWRVEALRHYLVPGFSAWEFEHTGTQMSRYTDHRFLGPFEPLIDYEHGVEKGRWKPEGLAICHEAGVTIDLSRRAAFTSSELDIHYQNAIPGSRLADIKAHAIEAFHAGRQRQGLGYACAYLRTKPFALDMLGIAVFGLAGKRSLAWLQLQHLSFKLSRARRKAYGP